MLLVVLPRPDTCQAGTKPRRAVNIFKKLLRKQLSFPTLTALKSRPENRWQGFQFGSRTGPATENGDDSTELDTPTSACRLYWDCAKTIYRGSVELRTPIIPNEGLAFCDMLSRTDKVPHQPTADPMSKEIPSPKQLLNHEDDTNPPIGGLAFLTRLRSPSGCPVNGISSTGASEQKVSQAIGSRTEEEEPSYPVPQFNPPKHERGMRRVSLVLRPVSSGGPAPQVLYPPPVKVHFPARRRAALPLPSPQRRSRQSIGHSQLPDESTHNVPQPGSPTSPTTEEGLIQLRVRTQQAHSYAPLGHRQGFKHVRGLNIRALPTPPLPSVRPIRPLPSLPITVPAIDHPSNLDGADTRPQSKSPKRLVSPASSGAPELRHTPPDTVLDIAPTWSQK